VADEARWLTCKVPTLRFDLTRSVVRCLAVGAEELGLPLREFLERIDLLRLATTVGTNAIIEGTGSRVGLVVTRGQEELIYGGRRPDALLSSFLDPSLVRGLGIPPAKEEVVSVCRELVGRGVRQVVVSFPREGDGTDAEPVVRQLVRDRYPEHYLRSVPLQLGGEVSACAEDDVRTATAVVNAYLHRDMSQLLHRADEELRAEGLSSPLLVVHANSGVARVAKTTAISTYSSGPSAGLSAAESIARRYGDSLVLTADMGGTTLDLGLVVHSRCETETRPLVAGVRVALPMNRTESIGCAGGSIVRMDDDQVVIGPQSAGAIPGPAAFGRGGELATLTDADVASGLLETGKEFGGQFVLEADKARAALARHVAAPLGCSIEEAALLVERAAAEQIGEAIRSFLSRRAIDPSEVTLYAFGGAGPVHAWASAMAAGIRMIRSFPFGSGFSAYGCTVVDVRHRYEAFWGGFAPTEEDLRRILEPLVARGLADVRAERFDVADIEAVVLLLGKDGLAVAQSSPMREVAGDGATARLATLTLRAFEGWEGVEGVALEVTVPVPRGQALPTLAPPRSSVPVERRQVWWEDRPLETAVYRWGDLPAESWIDGPVLVEERDTTHAVGPGWRLTLDESGNALWRESRR
jgi:N-methylhydantoinase A